MYIDFLFFPLQRRHACHNDLLLAIKVELRPKKLPPSTYAACSNPAIPLAVKSPKTR
jgi:hypothetical protein